jgi:hypothetical protein
MHCSEFHELLIHLNKKHGAFYWPYTLVPDPQTFQISWYCKVSVIFGWLVTSVLPKQTPRPRTPRPRKSLYPRGGFLGWRGETGSCHWSGVDVPSWNFPKIYFQIRIRPVVVKILPTLQPAVPRGTQCKLRSPPSVGGVVCYEEITEIKRELNRILMYECLCDERLRAKADSCTRLEVKLVECGTSVYYNVNLTRFIWNRRWRVRKTGKNLQ